MRFFRKIIFLLSRMFGMQDRSVYKKDFDDCASSYDLVVTRPVLSAVTERTIKTLGLAPGMQCVDLGCGTGDATSFMLDHVRPDGKVFACDFSPMMVLSAQNRIGNAQDAIIQEADMHSFLTEFSSDSIDCIGSFWSLEYCDHLRVIRQAHRALKPGGKLCVVVNHRNSLEELQAIVTPILLKNIFSLRRIPPLGMIDNTAKLTGLARKAGFKMITSIEQQAPCHFKTGSDLVRWICEGGPAAGLRGSIRSNHREKIYSLIKRDIDRLNGITINFRFSIMTATK